MSENRMTAEELALRNDEIVNARLNGEKLADIGEKYGLTKERVRQICKKIVTARIRKAIEACKECNVKRQFCMSRYCYEASRVGLDLKVLAEMVEDVYGPKDAWTVD